MSKNRQVVKQIHKIYQNLSQYPTTIKERRNWLLRNFLIVNKQKDWVNSGFVLPMVSLVSLVVVLLTTAILFRSFERSKNASNVRVNEATLNAATPAIDRAKAKLNKLFADSRLPRSTPTDTALWSHFVAYANEYTFGDEKQLKVELTTAERAKLTTAERAKLTSTTATTEEKNYLTQQQSMWMYPVDTDNNGKYDTYTMYGIYFKNPPVNNGAYERYRNPLEARTIPMMGGNVGSGCGDVAGTSATLVGNSGWFKTGSQLKKSFFAYTANVPITNPPNTTDYEAYKGNRGFSALEYQQERVQLPLMNNAVVYEDDLVLTPAENMNLNGRIITNSNFATGSGSTAKLYQISSQHSCFYEADNSKIIVAGNLAAGGYTDDTDRTNGTQVHLYEGKGATPDTASSHNIKTHKSVTQEPKNILYNSLAYTERINRLVEAQMVNSATGDPDEVKQGITKAKEALGLSSYTTAEEAQLRNQQLTLYFRRRTRRIPYEEVAFNGDALKVGSGQNYASTGTSPVSPLNKTGTDNNTLRPPDEWIYPFSPTNGSSKTGTVGSNTVTFSNLDLNTNGTNKLRPSATEPQRLQKVLQGAEQSVGDRISVGNNLPELWWNGTKFVGSNAEDTQNISSRYWDDPNNTNSDNIRTRTSQIQQLPNLGNIIRDGDWEQSAAQIPSTPLEPVGGLRVVTGAGVYLPNGFTATSTSFTAASKEIWSDQKPAPQVQGTSQAPTSTTIKPYWMYANMPGATGYADITYKYDTLPTTNTTTPYLRMRATAVYHYKSTGYDQSSPTPIACVSSFYVPTNSTTAKNQNLSTLPDTATIDGMGKGVGGLSNNGIVYGPPTGTTTTYATALAYISDLKYPNGRFIDDGLLKRALAKTAANRTLSEKSAIDAQICALQIFDGTISVATTPPVPHGAIRETTFLDARQVKTVHNSTSTTDFNLDKKDREPLEIRATVLDMEQLRTTTIGSGPASTQEYLLPNSGIIYASRDDALPDWSAVTDYTAPTESQRRISSVDHKLDPNRRPNGIVLVNGRKLWRDPNYRDVEKGLILASNLPVYIRGTFNLHGNFSNGIQEEFTETLASDWNNFYGRTKDELNSNFACRKNDPRLQNCTVGDEWRPAAVLADAMTVLSDNFRFGFRDEGDYDWKPDASTITGSLANDFSTTNSYVPVARWRDTSTNRPKDLVPDVSGNAATTGFQGSSYLNNFVTPVGLQIPSGIYFTELCSAANCATNTTVQNNPASWELTNNCGSGSGQRYSVAVNSSGTITGITDTVTGDNYQDNGNNKIKTGTLLDDPATFIPGCPASQMPANSPRRLLFVRQTTSPYNLVTPLKVLAVDVNNKIQKFTLGSTTSDAGTALKSPSSDAFMPWLKTVTSGSTTTLKPVLQLDQPFATPADPNNTAEITSTTDGNWLQDAASTTFNLIIAAGDVPGRPNEHAGGLHNFPRLLENWQPGTDQTTRISGSFMQLGRSAYATAPFYSSLNDDAKYTYANNLNDGKLPYYRPSIRQWGYDVGLLSQSPDAFALKLVRIPKDKPDEYYREAGRDDTWVQNLLCAKNVDGDNISTNDTYAIDASQRPSGCQS